jgi:hypothetical protein
MRLLLFIIILFFLFLILIVIHLLFHLLLNYLLFLFLISISSPTTYLFLSFSSFDPQLCSQCLLCKPMWWIRSRNNFVTLQYMSQLTVLKQLPAYRRTHSDRESARYSHETGKAISLSKTSWTFCQCSVSKPQGTSKSSMHLRYMVRKLLLF